MPFKPKGGPVDIRKLRTVLNNTHLMQKDNPLYQFCDSLLGHVGDMQDHLTRRVDAIKTAAGTNTIVVSGGSGGGGGSTGGTITADYVVVSNGSEPPTAIDDGFGSFFYIPYTP